METIKQKETKAALRKFYSYYGVELGTVSNDEKRKNSHAEILKNLLVNTKKLFNNITVNFKE